MPAGRAGTTPVLSNRFFLPYREKPEELATAKRNLCDFIAAGSGGPKQYGGRSMPEAHRGMNISVEEYMAAVDDIMSLLSKHDVEEGVQREVLAIAYALKDKIIRV